MNQNSLIRHYKILKNIKEMIYALTQSCCIEINPNMMWVVYENDIDSYQLFYNRYNNELKLVRLDKKRKVGWNICKLRMSSQNVYCKNRIYGGVCEFGLRYNGKQKDIHYESYNHESVIIDVLPMDSVHTLLVDNSMEELQFQYNTLYDFTGSSFQMYCILSLLINVDHVNFEFKNNFINIDLLLKVSDDDIDGLQSSMEGLKTKLIEDIK